MITFKTPKHHWNYFLALEQDLQHLSRFIEFAQPNLGVYSIELAHILLSASSEVDVILKQLCDILVSGQKAENMNDYRNIIAQTEPHFCVEHVEIGRYTLSFQPWDNWPKGKNPDWWKAYNNVKHERNNNYPDASLQHTVNAMGGLLISVIYYYKNAFTKEAGRPVDFLETTHLLQPASSFLTMNDKYYLHTLVG